MPKFTADTTVIFTGENYEVVQSKLLEFFRSLDNVKIQRVSLVEWDQPDVSQSYQRPSVLSAKTP